MFLEERLNQLSTEENVIVMLSSATVYGIGETEEPVVMQDSAGNHYTWRWLKAIETHQLEKQFVEADFFYKESWDAYVITLAHTKDEYNVSLLTTASNNA